MTDLEALVVAAYVFADEYRVPARQGRPALTSDAELVALAVAQAAIGISSDRQFLGLIGRVLPGWFPHLPDQSQYDRRLRAVGVENAVPSFGGVACLVFRLGLSSAPAAAVRDGGQPSLDPDSHALR